MAITLSFSSIVYVNVSGFTERALLLHEKRVENRLRQMPRGMMLPEKFQEPFTEEAVLQIRANTLYLLLSINIAILIITGSLAYWFAGLTLKPIEEMTNRQKRFIADASHELKTPLTAMKTQLEVTLRDKNLKLDDAKEIIKSIIDDVDSLANLANYLLKQHKYESVVPLNKNENISIKNIIESTYEIFENKIKNRKINTTFDLEDFMILANKNSLIEVISIIFDNAIKFNVEGGSIHIETSNQNKKGVIKILNTGIGISEKDLPHIFERFYRAETSRSKTEYEGFGLGLAIAKDIVTSLNGKISATSMLDEKTEFKIVLPIDNG